MAVANLDIREQIRREAHRAGLHDFDKPTIESVEKRRLQLWVVAAIVVIGLAAATGAVSWAGDFSEVDWFEPSSLRLAVFGLALGFCAYAIEKEVHLRRLNGLLVDERVLNAALTNRLKETTALVGAVKVVNSVLELDEVLEVIVDGALEMLDAQSGSVMLLVEDELHASVVRGNDSAKDARVPMGQSVAGRVAQTREPMIISGQADEKTFPGHEEREQPVDSAMCVPLEHRGELLGVLNINAGPGRFFDEYDLHVVSLFAEPVAAALAHGRVYEAERNHVAELLEQDRKRSQFVAALSHELRTPLTSIRGAIAAAKRPVGADQRAELMEVIERQVQRLAIMADEMRSAARVDRHASIPLLRRIDLAALVRLVAFDSQIAGRPVIVEAPGHCEIRVDPESMRRVIGNLIENAHKYGAPPVRVILQPNGDRVILSVVDAGPGIAEADREKVFERYYRAEQTDARPGLGLGLPIVRGLIDAGGGSVWVEDAPGGGAAFRVALPARVRDEQEVVACPASPRS